MATQTAKVANFTQDNPKIFLQGLFEASNTQKHPLGTIRQLSDGRCFVYARLGANVVAGDLLQSAVHAAANTANLAVGANANIGDKSVTVTPANDTITANEFAEGYLHINTPVANGAGFMYKIRGHAAVAANTAVAMKLYDSLLANIHAAASKATITHHPCYGAIPHLSPPTEALQGVVPITVANYADTPYVWIQNRGPAVVEADGTLVKGERVITGSADGTVSPSSGNAIDDIKLQIVGTVIRDNANDHWALIDLNIA